eukprot:gene17151-20397_t
MDVFVACGAEVGGPEWRPVYGTDVMGGGGPKGDQCENAMRAVVGASGKVASVWTSPVCGNQLCEVPYEVASFGRFGCKVDCGEEYNLYQIVVRLQVCQQGAAPELFLRLSVLSAAGVQADFRTSPSAAVSPPELLESVTWNLCYRDSVEESVGLGDQCWYETDQTFESSYATVLEEFQVPDKDWFIRLENDYYHLVDGHVYVGDAYEAVGTTPEWISCT